MHREQEDARRSIPSYDFLDRIQSARLWHGHVQYRDIRIRFLDRLDSLNPVLCLSDYFHVRLSVDQHPETRAQNGMIIGYNESNFRRLGHRLSRRTIQGSVFSGFRKSQSHFDQCALIRLGFDAERPSEHGRPLSHPLDAQMV